MRSITLELLITRFTSFVSDQKVSAESSVVSSSTTLLSFAEIPAETHFIVPFPNTFTSESLRNNKPVKPTLEIFFPLRSNTYSSSILKLASHINLLFLHLLHHNRFYLNICLLLVQFLRIQKM